MNDIDSKTALAIIHRVGSSGTPPEFGARYFTAGFEEYLEPLRREYFENILPLGISTFKLVLGYYGGGKTHFLYNVRDLAWKYGYLVSIVPLNPSSCPFDRLELVYKEVVSNLMPPPSPSELSMEGGTSLPVKGIEGVVELWVERVREEIRGRTRGKKRFEEMAAKYTDGMGKGIESSSFSNAVRLAFTSLMNDDGERYSMAIPFLKGEGGDLQRLKEYHIFEAIDRSTAFRFLRSLSQWVQYLGYRGLAILFDEAERMMSISRARNRIQALDNLRQMIDECGNTRWRSNLILYAVPDEKSLYGYGRGSYEALHQRVSGLFGVDNPEGVRINLERLSIPADLLLQEIGKKLSSLFEKAYGFSFPEPVLRTALAGTVRGIINYSGAANRRLFVKTFIKVLHHLKKGGFKDITNEEIKGMIIDTEAGEAEERMQEADEEEF